MSKSAAGGLDVRAKAATLCNQGVRLAQQGEHAASVRALSQAAELLPQEPLIHYNLGRVLRGLGRLPEAMRAYERALALRPEADTHNNLGLVLHEMGLIEQAHAQLSEAVQLAPEMAGAWCNLGNALRELGRREQADAAFVRALEVDAECVAARYNRFATLYAQEQPEPAIAWLSELLRRCPRHNLARYQHAAALMADATGLVANTTGLVADATGLVADATGLIADMTKDSAPSEYDSALVPGDEARWLKQACNALRQDGAAHLASSLLFMQEHWRADTRLFADSRDTLVFALQQAAVSGTVLELGVRFGHSLRFIAEHAGQPVHGFDSFQGLPEDWGEREAGLYTTEGQLPEVPAHVTLHPGLFADTLPPFVEAHPGPLRLANVDCDIYASTRDALHALDSTIVPGSVLVFDEYLGNPRWEQDEHRALNEWADACGAQLQYLAFSPFSRQAVVRISSR